jgi:hypothetical protein
MIYLKWILLLVCIVLVLWPLLARRAGRPGEGGKAS